MDRTANNLFADAGSNPERRSSFFFVMASGFNSPNILFLNTYDAPDRRYIAEIVPKLKAKGYTRYVELYAGGFAMPFVVASSGIAPENIFCYDISLYSCILGYLFSGKDLNELQVKKDGQIIVLNGKDDCENAAILLYEQALARFELGYNICYVQMLAEDMINRRSYHVGYIADRLRKMDDKLHGLHFERMYIWEAFDKEKESEGTFICSNPPTYKGAYEKFFETGKRITWIGDDFEYEIWDGSKHCKELMIRAENAKPLLFLLQQAKVGNAATEHPVFGRYLSVSQNVYYNSNRPDEVEEINGLKTITIPDKKFAKSKYPIMPSDYRITRDSKMYVFVEETNVAEYYRKIWLHRINGKAVSFNLCVVIDGYLAGFIGLDLRSVVKGFRGDEDFAILSYAVAAPNKISRNARLLVHIALSRRVVIKALASSKNKGLTLYMTIAKRLCTVEYSRYYEVKGLRGLMKLDHREKKEENMNALYYFGDFNENDERQVLDNFITAEERYGKK